MNNQPVDEARALPPEPIATLNGGPAPEVGIGRKAFRALRHRNYRLFFFGQMISVIGTWMQFTALQLLIVQLEPENPKLWLGINSFVPLLPLVPLALVAGSLADRFSKRNMVVLTQTAMMLQAFALAALTLSGAIQTWHVLALTLVSGAANAIDVPARQSFVVEMVDDRADLGNAIALNSAIFNLGRALGPVLAGLLIAPLGYGVAFLSNGVSFLAVIAGLLLMRLPATPPRVEPRGLGAHTVEGLRYSTHNRTVRVLMSLVAVSAFLSMPFSTLMPIFATDVLSDSAQPIVEWVCSRVVCQTPESVPMGLLMGAFGGGALIGALLVGSFGERRRGRLLTAGNLGFPIALLLFAASRSFWLSIAILLGVGAFFVAQNALTNTLLQIITPDRLRGRVMSLYSLIFQGMMRAGGMQAGLVGELAGAPFAVGIGAILSAGYGLLVWWRWPEIRRLA